MLRLVLRREMETGHKLGAARHQLDSTELVLDRIESVAEVLLSGDAQQDSIQRKFLLSKLPALNNRISKKQTLEQAYLPSSRTREDRIRQVLEKGRQSAYFKTSKFGSGLQRKEFDRRIDAAEYNWLKDGIEGLLITKTRHQLQPDDDDVAERVVLDAFAPDTSLANLLILEAQFSDAKSAESWQLPQWLQAVVEQEITDQSGYSNRRAVFNPDPQPHDG